MKYKSYIEKYEQVMKNGGKTSTIRIENKIHYNDFLTFLKSKNPSLFFVKSDPSYLLQLENKIITLENKIEEM